jgi:Outer membrane protein beta-barrel domain
VLARFPTSLAAGVLLAFTFPSAAAAELHFTPMIGWTFQADTNLLDLDQSTSKVHWNFGGSVTLLGAGILGVEGVVVLTPGFFTGDETRVSTSHALAMMGNMVLTTPRNWTEYSLRPFLSGGFGLLGVSWTDVHNVFTDSGNIAAFNIGGGAIGFFSKRTGVRFDLRYYNSLKQGEEDCPIAFGSGCHLRYMTASVGVVIRR